MKNFWPVSNFSFFSKLLERVAQCRCHITETPSWQSLRMETQYLVPRTALQVGRRPDCEASSVVEHAGTLDLSQCGASTPHSLLDVVDPTLAWSTRRFCAVWSPVKHGKDPSGILFTWPYHLTCISLTYRSIPLMPCSDLLSVWRNRSLSVTSLIKRSTRVSAALTLLPQLHVRVYASRGSKNDDFYISWYILFLQQRRHADIFAVVVNSFITSAKEVMFLPVFVCLFVCLSVC